MFRVTDWRTGDDDFVIRMAMFFALRHSRRPHAEHRSTRQQNVIVHVYIPSNF